MANKNYGEVNFDKLFEKINQMGDKIAKSGADAEAVAERSGEQVGESFADGIERGLEDAASKISASSVKITKAFKDLAKKIISQNISLGGVNIDFSDIDINSDDFKKKLNDAFESIKIDSGIEFDSKATEKQFKNMLGLHIKYADKLSKLQEQKPKLTNPESIKANAKEQLAIIDGLKEIRRAMNDASDASISLPRVNFGDAKALRAELDLLEQIAKGEEKISKQRDANHEKLKKENKELKERNKLLEENTRLQDGEVPQQFTQQKTKVSKKTSDQEDLAAKRSKEAQSFVAQYNALWRELGEDDRLFAMLPKLMEQVTRGALTAADAIAKLREEATIAAEKNKQAQEPEKIRKNKFTGTINGKSGKFRIKPKGSVDDIIPKSNLVDITPEEADAWLNGQKEADALNNVGEAAESAAGKKKKFAKANKEVAESVGPSVNELKTEADAIEGVGEAAKKTNKIMSEEARRSAESMNFSTRDYERLYDEMEAFAELRKAENGYDLSRVSVNTDAHGNPLGATISYYKKATKETITETFKIDKAAQEAEDGVNRLVLSSRKATAGIADFEKATMQAINRQDQLIAQKNKTISSMSAVLDPNANKTLAGTDYETEVNRRIQAIKDEVAKLDQVDSAGERIILSEKDYLAVKRRIAELTQDAHNFIETSKRAKYGRDQFESHDVDSQVAYRKINLDAKISEWKRVGIYAGDLQAKAEELYHAIGQITDPSGLKKYLAGLKEANALAQLAAQDKKAEKEKQKPIVERQKQEQAYSDWWNKALFNKEQQEKAKDERVIEARKKKEQAYIAWWEKALKMQDEAVRKNAEKEKEKDKKKAELPYINYGKTTANSTQRKPDVTQGSIDALGATSPEILTKMDRYKAKAQEVLDIREKFSKDPNAAKDPALVKDFQKAAYEAEQLRRGIKSVIDEEQKMAQMSMEQGFTTKELSVNQLANLKNEMLQFAKEGAKGRVELKGWNDDNTKLYYTVTDSKGAVHEMTAALGQGTNQLYKMRTATKETGTLMQQIFKGVKVKAKELISYVIGGGSIYKAIEMLRQGVQYVREIDLALTELKKVTEETEETYKKFLDTASKTAAKVGSTIKDVVSSTADWARLGSVLAKTSISPII